MTSSFDDIRPYTDEELPAALRRIAAWSDFPQAVRFIYPDADIRDFTQHFCATRTVSELQRTVMNDAIVRIIQTTTTGFTYSGLEHLDPTMAYLFVSNHRDITLDAFLLQHLLIEHGFDTTHIVFGQNLLSSPVITDLFRANKLIRMERGGNPRAFYQSLRHLSQYIQHLVLGQHQSLWIAQKNGRAKDGIDTTAPAMLKMLCLGSALPPLDTLQSLHLVPLSISYEWDPCDALKATELHQSGSGQYIKAPDEDFRSVVTGIIGEKGHVHLHISAPLTPSELQPPAGADLYEHAAACLDRHIRQGYCLMPTNYAAHSLLTRQPHPGQYTEQIETRLLQRIDEQPHPAIRRLMLEAYAAPLTHTLHTE